MVDEWGNKDWNNIIHRDSQRYQQTGRSSNKKMRMNPQSTMLQGYSEMYDKRHDISLIYFDGAWPEFGYTTIYGHTRGNHDSLNHGISWVQILRERKWHSAFQVAYLPVEELSFKWKSWWTFTAPPKKITLYRIQDTWRLLKNYCQIINDLCNERWHLEHNETLGHEKRTWQTLLLTPPLPCRFVAPSSISAIAIQAATCPALNASGYTEFVLVSYWKQLTCVKWALHGIARNQAPL